MRQNSHVHSPQVGTTSQSESFHSGYYCTIIIIPLNLILFKTSFPPLLITHFFVIQKMNVQFIRSLYIFVAAEEWERKLILIIFHSQIKSND